MRAAVLVSELVSARLMLETAGVTLSYRQQELALTPEVEAALALALREAATNVQRHAQASRVDVDLQQRADNACMTIADDGRGCSREPGNGLQGMRERLEALGGSLRIASSVQGGTQLTMQVPLARSSSAGPQPACAA